VVIASGGSSRHAGSAGRVLAGAVAVALMWIAACVCVGLSYAVGMQGFDRPSAAGRVAAASIAIVGAVLVFASGPVAYAIGRRRVLLWLPIVVGTLWGAGIATAYVT
jgi:hypothetical protein